MLDATREVTRLFIRCAILFNEASTQQWKRTMQTASYTGSEWEGPSGETLPMRELKKEQASIEVQMGSLKETWVKYGCTILCDGCMVGSVRCTDESVRTDPFCRTDT